MGKSLIWCISAFACMSPISYFPCFVLSALNLPLDLFLHWASSSSLSPSPNRDLIPLHCVLCCHNVHLWPRFARGFSCSCQFMWSDRWEVRKEVKKPPIDSSRCCLLMEECQKCLDDAALQTLLHIYENCFLNPKLRSLFFIFAFFCLFFFYSYSLSRRCLHWGFTHKSLGAVSEFVWQQKAHLEGKVSFLPVQSDMNKDADMNAVSLPETVNWICL